MVFLFLGDVQSRYGSRKRILSRKKENGVNGIADLPVATWETGISFRAYKQSDRDCVEMKTSYTV